MSVAATGRIPGRASAQRRGWLVAHRFLLLRRLTQLAFLAVFLSGPWLGVWIAKGTLASSMTFDVLPLTDPLVLLQSLAARHWPTATALLGAGIVLGFYVLVGGRSYCAWVCPINPVTDLASWLRMRLGLAKGWQPKRVLRFWMLAAVIVVSAVIGRIAWEAVNPITILQRGLVFSIGLGWLAVLAVFVFDLLVARRGWCGHLCPVGAFYGLLGKVAVLRISAAARARCDECMDCYAVCPEPQVIAPALRLSAATASPVILSGDCSNCGRCADVCPENVFRYAWRGDRRECAPPRPDEVRKVA